MEERGKIAIVGATGFVGSHLVPHLVGRGHRVRGISRTGRRRPGWDERVETAAADVETGAGLHEALAGVDGVVHLVAIPREFGGRSFEEVNVRGVRRVVEQAGRAAVRRLVHVSALGATDDPRLRFLSSKWRGERIVRESNVDWVVLRPSLLFGSDDGFFNLMKVALTWWSPGVVAIPGDGQTRFQPLAADDLAIAIERCLTEPERSRSVYEIGGPEYVTYRQMVDAVMRATGKRRLKMSLPIPLVSAVTAVTDRLLPIFPVSHDQVASLSQPNFTDLDGFERAFGVRPRPMDLSYLRDPG